MIYINTYSNTEKSTLVFHKKPNCKELKLKYCERFHNINYNQVRLFNRNRVFLHDNDILDDKDYIIYIVSNNL